MNMLEGYLKKRMLGCAFKGIIHQGPSKEKFQDAEFLLTRISNRYVWGHPVGHPKKKFCFKLSEVRFYFDDQQLEPHQSFMCKLMESLSDVEDDLESGFLGSLMGKTNQT